MAKIRELQERKLTRSLKMTEGVFKFELFKRNIKVSLKEGASVDYAQECVDVLNSLPDETVENICEASIRYCNHFLAWVGEPVKEFGKPRMVLKHIAPKTLIIPREASKREPVVHMELDCEWEPEHGMEWIIRDGKLIYLGAFNGQNPFGFIRKDEWNFA